MGEILLSWFSDSQIFREQQRDRHSALEVTQKYMWEVRVPNHRVDVTGCFVDTKQHISKCDVKSCRTSWVSLQENYDPGEDLSVSKTMLRGIQGKLHRDGIKHCSYLIPVQPGWVWREERPHTVQSERILFWFSICTQSVYLKKYNILMKRTNKII